MESKLLRETYTLLDETDLTQAEITKLSGINEHWLHKFKARASPNPGVVTVEALHTFLKTWKRSQARKFSKIK